MGSNFEAFERKITERLDAIRIEVELEESVQGPYLAEDTGSFAPVRPLGSVGVWPERGTYHIEYMPGAEEAWERLRGETLEAFGEIHDRIRQGIPEERSRLGELLLEVRQLLARVDQLPHIADE